jgi:hypothetical protein
VVWSEEAQEAFVDARARAATDLFDAFIAARGLDFDTREWPAEAAAELSELQTGQAAEWNVLAFADEPPAEYPPLPDVAAQ